MMTHTPERPTSLDRDDTPDVAGAIAYALERLERDLPPGLAYHAVGHTRDDVLPAVDRLADYAGLTRVERDLLRVAAAFHDLGHIEGPADHESASIHIAQEVLPRYGFRPPDVHTISDLIAATRMPQQPTTFLQQVLADADLDCLGRVDFLRTSAMLRTEMAAQGQTMSDQEWWQFELSFLRAHRYWTAAARALRDTQKQRNIDVVVAYLSMLDGEQA